MDKTKRIYLWGLLLLMALSVLGTAGCRADRASSDEVQIALVGPVFPPSAGQGQVSFRIVDENDQPIDTASLKFRGDMSHAGMVPVLESVVGGEEGVYRLPVHWTMAGDWILTVDATLADGRQATKTFDISVTGEDPLCIDDQESL